MLLNKVRIAYARLSNHQIDVFLVYTECTYLTSLCMDNAKSLQPVGCLVQSSQCYQFCPLLEALELGMKGTAESADP